VSRSSSFTTVQDNQREIRLDIRQGESPAGNENLQLGELHLHVVPMPAGQVSIDVRFSYDTNGLLVVDAKNHQTDIAVSTVINQSTNVMSEEELRKALQKLDTLKVHPREQQENQYLVERAKRLYADLLGSDRLTVQGLLNTFEAALDTQDERIIRDAREVIKAGLDEFDKGFVL
jgi:molecular chaperone HscC